MHWTQKCTHPTGHHIDNQGLCHSCGAGQVPDRIVLVNDIDDDFEAAFSTLENAFQYVRDHHSELPCIIRMVELDA